MSAGKPTAAPWRVVGLTIQAGTADERNHVTVAECIDDAIFDDEVKANTRLIAAAPELLAALEEIVKFVSPGDDVPLADMLDNARAAIAKAKG
jgi:hypothetical protein